MGASSLQRREYRLSRLVRDQNEELHVNEMFGGVDGLGHCLDRARIAAADGLRLVEIRTAASSTRRTWPASSNQLIKVAWVTGLRDLSERVQHQNLGEACRREVAEVE